MEREKASVCQIKEPEGKAKEQFHNVAYRHIWNEKGRVSGKEVGGREGTILQRGI